MQPAICSHADSVCRCARALILRATRVSSWSKAGWYSLTSSELMPAARHSGRHCSSMIEVISESSFAAASRAIPKKGLASTAVSREAVLPLSSLMPVSSCRRRNGCGLMSKAGARTHRPSPTWRSPWFFRWSSVFETRWARDCGRLVGGVSEKAPPRRESARIASRSSPISIRARTRAISGRSSQWPERPSRVTVPTEAAARPPPRAQNVRPAGA